MPTWKVGTLMFLLRDVSSLFFNITEKAVPPGWHMENGIGPSLLSICVAESRL